MGEEEIREILKRPYQRVIVRDGDGYSGYILECEGCMTCGDTQIEVLSNLNDALECWMRSVIKHGQSAPEPLDKMLRLSLKDDVETVLRSVSFVCGAIEENDGLLFQGGCGEEVSAWDGYRCSDCTAMFHRDCIRKHFESHRQA